MLYLLLPWKLCFFHRRLGIVVIPVNWVIKSFKIPAQSLRFCFQVIRRIIGSMVPVYKKNYLVSYIRPNPDLYGNIYLLVNVPVVISFNYM